MLGGSVWELHGEEAEQVYYGLQDTIGAFLLINRGNHQTYIPIQHILYVDFAMSSESERIEKEIEEKWSSIYFLVQNSDYEPDELEELEWYSEEVTTYVRGNDGRWVPITNDPQVAQLMFEIDELDDKLDELLKKEE